MILKVVEQPEFDIHSFLLERKLSKRIIPITTSFPHTIGRIIAMEEHLVLSSAPSDLFKTAGFRLAHQFLQGVQFIHRHQVAHLDLKPDNIVIKKPAHLYIIDFSVSVRVPGPNFRMTGYQGTKGWVAPEVEQDLDTGYCPILADLWSTGKVLQYLTGCQDAFCGKIQYLTSQLQSPKPQQRPLLGTIKLGALFAPHQLNPILKSNRRFRSDVQGSRGAKRKCAQVGTVLDPECTV